jgi:acyl-coenzyme A synthetase/AMP-(fatty) acid ligase
MTSKLITQLLCLLCFLGTLPAAEPAEKVKIEALISHIQGLENATFIRNGSDYSAANAAKFLRAKWERNDKEVKTAADFIAKVASTSGTSGKPYVIRFKDGKETPCGEYLTAQLKKL